MNTKLLTEHHLEFLSLTGGCTDSSESTLVKMPHCWKSHVAAHFVWGVGVITKLRLFIVTERDEKSSVCAGPLI